LGIEWSRKPSVPVIPYACADMLLHRFKNIEDTIEVRHHVFVKTGYQAVELAEVGPRMSMRLFEIRAGTLDNKEGDVEWHLNQYTRTGRKKEYL
jgi:U3 small nucleolar ribonucleoprotein protein IMP4